MPDGGRSVPFPAAHSTGGKAAGRPVRAPDRCGRRHPRESDLQEAGSLRDSDLGTEPAVRGAAGEVPPEAGARDLRKRLSRTDETGTQTGFARGFEADSRS